MLRLYNLSMMKFLMGTTSAVKLEMGFVILSKLRLIFEKVSLDSVLHSLSISGSVSESTTSFSILFLFSATISYELPLALRLLIKIFLRTSFFSALSVQSSSVLDASLLERYFQIAFVSRSLFDFLIVFIVVSISSTKISLLTVVLLTSAILSYPKVPFSHNLLKEIGILI